MQEVDISLKPVEALKLDQNRQVERPLGRNRNQPLNAAELVVEVVVGLFEQRHHPLSEINSEGVQNSRQRVLQKGGRGIPKTQHTFNGLLDQISALILRVPLQFPALVVNDYPALLPPWHQERLLHTANQNDRLLLTGQFAEAVELLRAEVLSVVHFVADDQFTSLFRKLKHV